MESQPQDNEFIDYDRISDIFSVKIKTINIQT